MSIRFYISIVILITFICCIQVKQTYAQFPQLQPLPETGQLQVPATNPDNFTFIVAGDNRPHKSTDPVTETTKQVFKQAKDLAVPFILWTGDTVYGKNPEDLKLVESEYKEFLAVAKQSNIPIFNAPGNHELDSSKNVPNADMQDLYVREMGLLYGAFNYGNSRFIALNTSSLFYNDFKNEKDKPKETSNLSYINKLQLQLLKEDLDANKDKKHIFIFMHYPIKPRIPDSQLNPKSTQALLKLFKKYSNISYVLAGHEHLYYNPQAPTDVETSPNLTKKTNRPLYIVTGGGGAPLQKEPGGFYHFLLFQVIDKEVVVKIVKL